MFPKFTNELEKHNASGYHKQWGAVEAKKLHEWFQEIRLPSPPLSYVKFMAEIGPGRYYDGDLSIFRLKGGKHSVAEFTKEVENAGCQTLFAIGYEGTTDGCFCLSKNAGDENVYWFEWEESVIRTIHEDFATWIENSPGEYFNSKIYAGYKSIKDWMSIQKIIEERKAFKVELICFDKTLVYPPGHENDFLPRYHRVVLRVIKTKPVDLTSLTVKIFRSGSNVGNVNIEHISLDVENIDVGKEHQIEIYVFDPFNAPFDEITCIFDADIDLGSKSRIQYKEILPFL